MKNDKCIAAWLIAFLLVVSASLHSTEILLRENLQKAQAGDFIVTAQNKTFTLLMVRDKSNNVLYFEEVTVPMNKIPKNSFSWRQWLERGASGHTSWVLYAVNLSNAEIEGAFSFTKNEWYAIPQTQNFLSTLLNLHLKNIPDRERKRVGLASGCRNPEWRSLWQPRLVVDGQVIPGVQFSAWKTHWPKDGTELSNKTIEIYVPQENQKYPSYFPYWLQISGMIGKAKVRIIDSGSKLVSPQGQRPFE